MRPITPPITAMINSYTDPHDWSRREVIWHGPLKGFPQPVRDDLFAVRLYRKHLTSAHEPPAEQLLAY
jgi:hypothetical protein